MATKQEMTMSVQTDDIVARAMDAALARINAVKPSLGPSLIMQIPASEWDGWSGADEKALVADPCGLDAYDACDEDMEEAKAA